MAQSVWVAVITAGGAGIKLVDMTGKPGMAALNGGALDGSHHQQTMVGALVEATRLANERGRRVTSASLLGNELVIIVD